MRLDAPRNGILLLVAALTATLAACGGSEPASTPTSAPATTTVAAPTEAPSPTAAAATTAATPSVDKQITVTIFKKKVSPPTSRIQVAKGSNVRVTVTSDAADELHIHGYDLKAELSAGKPSSIEFTADKTGLFEVETHESGLVLFQLLVR